MQKIQGMLGLFLFSRSRSVRGDGVLGVLDGRHGSGEVLQPHLLRACLTAHALTRAGPHHRVDGGVLADGLEVAAGYNPSVTRATRARSTSPSGIRFAF